MRAKMTPNTLQEAVLGKRWSQAELLAAGIAHEVVEADKLSSRAAELGEELAPKVAQGAWGSIKESLYEDVATQMARRRVVHYPDVDEKAFYLRMERKSKL